MVWVFWASTIMLTAPSITLSRGAFVGVFASDGQPLAFSAPIGKQWVSNEQVQRELQFRGWTPPLKNDRMAELAKALEADFAVDMLTATVKASKGWQVLLVVRVVSAQFCEIVHLSQMQTKISNPDELPMAVEKLVLPLLTKFPLQIPFATVQLREGGKRVHLTAASGEWRKGTQLLFFRESNGQKVPLGKGRIVSASLPAGGSRWLLEGDLTETSVSVRAGDKVIQIFNLPKPFAKWQ